MAVQDLSSGNIDSTGLPADAANRAIEPLSHWVNEPLENPESGFSMAQ
jgi:hypothetical protein